MKHERATPKAAPNSKACLKAEELVQDFALASQRVVRSGIAYDPGRQYDVAEMVELRRELLRRLAPSETRRIGPDDYTNGWNEALDRALLANEAEQAKYKAETWEAAAIRGAIEHAMDAIRALKVKP